MLATSAEDGRGQLRFSLFDVPVRVDATFLILLVIVALPMTTEGTGYALGLAVIVLASVLGHELGHAAAVQALVEPNPSIVLYGLGGLTSHQPTASRPRSLVVSLCGPAAGLLVGAAALAAGRASGGEAEELGELGWALTVLWTVVNLLPVLPLDGGRALETALPGAEPVRHRMVVVVSLVTCATGAVLAWRRDAPVLVAFAGWFGLTNLVDLRSARKTGATPAGITEELQELYRDFHQLHPSTAAALEDRARAALSDVPAEARPFVGTVLIGSLLAQDRHDGARDLLPALGPEGCDHAMRQLVDLGPDAAAVLEERLRVRSSAYDATLLFADRALHHDWDRITALTEERPPEAVPADWLSLATGWAFHADEFVVAMRLGQLLEGRVNNPAASYNVACAAARGGDIAAGLAALERTADRGWDDLAQLDGDDDLAALRSSPEWSRIRDRMAGASAARGPGDRRWGAALGLAATLAVTALSVRLADADQTDSGRFGSIPGVSDLTGELVAQDPATGRVVWRRSGPWLAPYEVDDDLVLVADVDGGVDALDARDGSHRWSSGVRGHPMVGPEVVVITDAGDEESIEAGAPPEVTTVDRATGERLWSRPGAEALAVLGDVVVVTGAERETVGVDAVTGAERWSVHGHVVHPVDETASDLVVQDAERLTAIDPTTGRTGWTALGEVVGVTSDAAWVRRAGEAPIVRIALETGDATPIRGVSDVDAVVGEARGVVVLAGGSTHWGVEGGTVAWEREVDRDDSFPTVGDGLLVEIEPDAVVAFDVVSGRVRWRAEVPDLYYAQPTAGVVLASATDDTIVLDADTGAERWTIEGRLIGASTTDDLLVTVELDT